MKFVIPKAGDIKTLSDNAVKEKINIVVVGGDGSVNESLSSLKKHEYSFSYHPNWIRQWSSLSYWNEKNIKKAIKQLKKYNIAEIDTCLINNKSFINIAGIGFDAHIANLFLNQKNRGFFKYVKLIFQQLNYKAKSYHLKYNNDERKIEAFLISFANASQYGNNVKICPQADIKDGLFDVVIVHKFPKWKIPILIVKLFLGKINTFKYVEIIKLKNLEINSD